MNPSALHAMRGPEASINRRVLAKQKTRGRLLSAARMLISERGYEAATVRDIAAAADLSTGALFACFADKAALFTDVIVADFEDMADAMARADGGLSARESLLDVFSAAYAQFARQPRLIQAAIGFSWLRDSEAERRARLARNLVTDEIEKILRRGIANGEWSSTVNVPLAGEMLWTSYVSNYRQAVFDGWDSDALRAKLAMQIDIVLAGMQGAA